MKEILADIRKKLQDGAYRNEEHVRFALVGRILQALGWDIWNPRQVDAEFVAAPDEDKTKVDLALFSKAEVPDVFIEVKNVGKAMINLAKTEEQLRDYNRNITALFCVITDGAIWRFYYSQTGGKFSGKCFEKLDLSTDDLGDIEASFTTFLGRDSIQTGVAKKEAEVRLSLSQKQRAMDESLSEAKRLAQEAPFPSLPDALVALVEKLGFGVSREEAAEFISAAQTRSVAATVNPATDQDEREDEPETVLGKGAVVLSPDHPKSLTHTRIDKGRFAGEVADDWNKLVRVGVKLAMERGHTVVEVRQLIAAQVKEGTITGNGFHPVLGTKPKVSVQNTNSNLAWKNALALAKALKCRIQVEFRWLEKPDAEHPGKAGSLRWSP